MRNARSMGEILKLGATDVVRLRMRIYKTDADGHDPSALAATASVEHTKAAKNLCRAL